MATMDIQRALDDGHSVSDVATEIGNRGIMNVAKARADGWGDQDIVKEGLRRVAAQSAASATSPRQQEADADTASYGGVPESTSANIVDGMKSAAKAIIPDSVQRGFAHSMQGAADTANMVGAPPVVGAAAQAMVDPQQAATPLEASKIPDDLRAGNYWQAAKRLPSAVGEGVPMMAAGLAGASLAPEGAAATGAAALSTGLAGAFTQTADAAKARAAANGRTTPNEDDIARAAASSFASGAFSSLGLKGNVGGQITNGVRRALGLGETALDPITGAIANAAVHGVAGGAGAAVNDAASTYGTPQGIKIDPYDVAAGAGIGAASKLGMDAAGAGANAIGDRLDGTTAARNRANAYLNADSDDQRLIMNRAAALKAAQSVADNTIPEAGETTFQAQARKAAGNIGGVIDDHLDSLKDIPNVSPDDLAALKGLLKAKGPLEATDLKPIDNLPLPDDTKSQLGDLYRQRAILLNPDNVRPTSPSFLGVSPELAGGITGGLIGGHIGYGTGSLWAGGAGHVVGSVLGSGLTKAITNATGIRSIPLVKDGQNAASMLQAAGVQPPDALTGVRNATQGVQDAISQVRAQDPLTQLAISLGKDPATWGLGDAAKAIQKQRIEAAQSATADQALRDQWAQQAQAAEAQRQAQIAQGFAQNAKLNSQAATARDRADAYLNPPAPTDAQRDALAPPALPPVQPNTDARLLVGQDRLGPNADLVNPQAQQQQIPTIGQRPQAVADLYAAAVQRAAAAEKAKVDAANAATADLAQRQRMAAQAQRVQNLADQQRGNQMDQMAAQAAAEQQLAQKAQDQQAADKAAQEEAMWKAHEEPEDDAENYSQDATQDLKNQQAFFQATARARQKLAIEQYLNIQRASQAPATPPPVAPQPPQAPKPTLVPPQAQQAPQPAPASPAPGPAAPQAPVNPVYAAAQARSASGPPPLPMPTPAEVQGLVNLNQLPETVRHQTWAFRIANDAAKDLNTAGRPAPLNYQLEALNALKTVAAERGLSDQAVQDLWNHQGWHDNELFTEMRNVILRRYGIERGNLHDQMIRAAQSQPQAQAAE